jgi:hypothetical protein
VDLRREGEAKDSTCRADAVHLSNKLKKNEIGAKKGLAKEGVLM